jgi:hypothetical protein
MSDRSAEETNRENRTAGSVPAAFSIFGVFVILHVVWNCEVCAIVIVDIPCPKGVPGDGRKR